MWSHATGVVALAGLRPSYLPHSALLFLSSHSASPTQSSTHPVTEVESQVKVFVGILE